MDTYTRRIIDIVSYEHKKYGFIEIKSESKKTKMEILDIGGANPAKRIKVEALMYGSQGGYAIISTSRESATSTKPPNMQPFSAPPFQRYGGPNGFQNIFQHCATRPSQWFKPQQPNVKLNINQIKSPGVSVGFPMPTFNFTQNAPDSTTPAKQTPNEKNDNKETTLNIGEGVLEASLLQRKEALISTPRNKFLNAQSSLISKMPQGVIKLLSAQESSPKFPTDLEITRPSPLIIQKLKERQLYNKMKSCGANVNMDTQTKFNNCRLNLTKLSATET